MTFWDEHAKAEAEHAARERAKLPPSPLDAPDTCLECDHVGDDVFFGSCAECFRRWEES